MPQNPRHAHEHSQQGAVPSVQEFTVEIVAIADLRPHPRNYQDHPSDELEHLTESIIENGIYRNIVIASDNVILAGHGVVKAAAQMGKTQIPVYRLNVDSQHPRALKVLVGDNEIARLSMKDDRALTELLKELNSIDMHGLVGTGFDDNMLAGLLYVTRPMSEVKDKNEAAHWVGMPEYEDNTERLKVIVLFRNAQDRAQFAKRLDLEFTDNTRMTLSTWWPQKEQEDRASVRFEG